MQIFLVVTLICVQPSWAGPFIAALHFNFKELPYEAGKQACSNALDVSFSEAEISGGLAAVQCVPNWHSAHDLGLKLENGKMTACLIATRSLGFLESIISQTPDKYTCYVQLKAADREFKAVREGEIVTISIGTMTWKFDRNNFKLMQTSDSELIIWFNDKSSPFHFEMHNAEAVGDAHSIVMNALGKTMVVY